VSVSNTDNEPPAGFIVSPTSGLTTTEAGGTATFTVALTGPPTANVTIGLTSSNPTEGTVSPASLTFTPANGTTPQTVTVTGADDGVVDGNVAYSIVTAPAASSAGSYNSLNPPDVSVTNVDNDVAVASNALTVVVVGNGTVTTTGINCGADCSESYPIGAVVSLAANPASGARLAGWSGACTGTGTCKVTMDGAKSVTATFEATASVSVGQTPGILPNGDKQLTATLGARPGCGPITGARFGTVGVAFQNATVSIDSPSGGPTNQTAGFTYTPPSGTTSLAVSIQRAVPSGAATVPIVLSYAGCADWSTFVGGGSEAFR
jgi:hypothetical protein